MRLTRVIGDESEIIHTGDVYDSVNRQAAVAAFLDPANCPEGSYLVFNARPHQHIVGWITVAIMTWRSGSRSVSILDLGEDETRVRATVAETAINTQLAKIVGGTSRIFPSSEYRRSRR